MARPAQAGEGSATPEMVSFMPLHPAQHPRRVILADDHVLIRRSLRLLLDSRPDVEVIAECSDGREVVTMVQELRPDIVLMDVSMPELNGIEATRQIKQLCPTTRVIILTAAVATDQVREALRAGALGYILKRSDIDELVLAISLVSRGNTYFSNELAEKLDLVQLMHEAQMDDHRSDLERLSVREREVLQLLAEGYTGREVADKLFISPKTVEGHKTRLMQKLGARNRSDLIRFALTSGLVSGDRGREDDQLEATGK